MRISFLAAGEYNENYVVESPIQRTVFRINHGTQLGLEDQISYEFSVLQAVEKSGVTPIPLQLCPTDQDFPRGVMLMEYIPGTPLEYERDFRDAAALFALIHALPAPANLIRQAHPVAEIAAESRSLLDRHADHPMPKLRDHLHAYADTIEALGAEADPEMAAEPACIVNTEVNSGNFIRLPQDSAGARLRLVDWEKAVVSSRYQDLGHFLVPTTTQWKTDFVFDSDRRREFLEVYRETSGLPVSLDELDHRTMILEKTILLRALSWCYMAYYEYTKTDRPLSNEATFARITRYLTEAESLIAP